MRQSNDTSVQSMHNYVKMIGTNGGGVDDTFGNRDNTSAAQSHRRGNGGRMVGALPQLVLPAELRHSRQPADSRL